MSNSLICPYSYEELFHKIYNYIIYNNKVILSEDWAQTKQFNSIINLYSQ